MSEFVIQNDYKEITEGKKNKKKQASGSNKRKWLYRILLFGIFSGIGMFVLGIITVLGVYFYYSKDLPKINSLNDYHPKIITNVFANDGRKIAEFFKERRIVIDMENIPKQLINAFIAAEDSRFYKHKGIDLISIGRAFFKNLEAGTIVQGGSTITQQVTKSFLLTSERTYERKIREAILAYKIERYLTKDEILYLYLNQIYLGHGAYGVEAAAQNYFNKSVKDLNLAECAILAGLPQAPSKYSPFYHFEKAKNRQIYVLNQMVDKQYITQEEAAAAIEFELDIMPRKNLYIEEVPYYTEYVRNYVEEKYGRDMLYTQGLKIETVVNLDLQKIAREEVDNGLRAIDKRQGYRGPLKHIKKEEFETFLANSRKKLPESGIQKDLMVQGLVVKVEQKKVTVRIGPHMGYIPFGDMKWARKPNPKRYPYYIRHPKYALKTGDIILVKCIEYEKDAKLWQLSLEQEPEVQAALLCIEAETGNVLTMIGGRDFTKSQFNRAIQSRRQPGSAFKPFVYSAALDRGPSLTLSDKSFEKMEELGMPLELLRGLESLKNLEYHKEEKLVDDINKTIDLEVDSPMWGIIRESIDKIEKNYTPASMIVDTAIVYEEKKRHFKWRPKNYEKEFFGPTMLCEALTHSRNVVTIKLLQDIGVDYVIEYVQKFGITSKINRDLSIALGSSGVSLLEIVRGYAVFCNGGELVKPLFIKRITDRRGTILEENRATKQRVIDKATAYCMTSMMKSVVDHGTATRVKELKRPVAGKTGTTNHLFDAWFVGFTPKYVTGVWVGFDKEKSMGRGETGSRAAAPIWLEYMKRMMDSRPVRVFTVPPGIEFATIDKENGLLAIPESKETRYQCFKEGTVPDKYAPRPDIINDQSDFFKENM
jgi:membrane carboxypeptidase/penicillin-binding protein